MSPDLSVLPGPGVAVTIDQYPCRERSQSWNLLVGEGNDRCIACPLNLKGHWQRNVFISKLHLRREQPATVFQLADLRDPIPFILRRRIFLPACNREMPD